MFILLYCFFIPLRLKMIYAYIRVSTDKQTVENQRLAIQQFAIRKEMIIDRWISETVSGTTDYKNRKLGSLLNKMKKGDTLILSEISRLGRNLMGIMSILNMCMKKETMVLTVKEGYEMGNNINSQILAFAFSLSAQIERDLISQRTKEGLARLKAEGVKLGRQFGSKNTKYKLSGKEKIILQMLSEGKTKVAICRRLKCNQTTLNEHLKRMSL